MKTEKSTQNATLNKYKEQALHHRFRFLVGAAVVGIVLALGWYFIAHALAIDSNGRLAANLTMLLLSLLVFCLLWFFRTHDTNEQIQKTQANINTSMLHKAIDFALTSQTNDKNITGPDLTKRAIGLKMLAQLRRTDSDPEFKKQIDFVTRGLDLTQVLLADANLQGVYLREAYMPGVCLPWTNLQEVDLQKANLRKADLREADLQDANLQEALLQGADLQGARLQGVDLRGANYDITTRFPPDFNPQDAGMIDTNMIDE